MQNLGDTSAYARYEVPSGQVHSKVLAQLFNFAFNRCCKEHQLRSSGNAVTQSLTDSTFRQNSQVDLFHPPAE